jgi:hypothetical protein
MTLRRAFFCVALVSVAALLTVPLALGAAAGVLVWLVALGLVVLHDTGRRPADLRAGRSGRPGTIAPGPRPSIALTGHP